MSEHYSFIFTLIWFLNEQISKNNADNYKTRGSRSLYCNQLAFTSSEACFLQEILQLQTLFWQKILKTATDLDLDIIVWCFFNILFIV